MKERGKKMKQDILNQDQIKGLLLPSLNQSGKMLIINFPQSLPYIHNKNIPKSINLNKPKQNVGELTKRLLHKLK